MAHYAVDQNAHGQEKATSKTSTRTITLRGTDAHSKRRRKMEMPKIESAQQIEFDVDQSAKFAKRMNWRNTSFLCAVEWSWSPVNERMESYYLQRRHKHWILWIRSYDDNYGRWERPTAMVRCPREKVDEDDKRAAMVLLAAFLTECIRLWDPELDRFHAITETGSLSMEEIDVVANAVWNTAGRASI
jgi:hypothetical protein